MPDVHFLHFDLICFLKKQFMTAVNLMNLGLIRNLLAFDFVHVYTVPFVSKRIKVGIVDHQL